jgi:hypothetical protein
MLPSTLPVDWSVEQSLTANTANEVTDIVLRAGSSEWSIPEYDRNGNAVSYPVFTTTGYGPGSAEYDAWNRRTSSSTAYDGANRRISVGNRHYYYSSAWQVLEERNNASPNTASAERQFIWGLRQVQSRSSQRTLLKLLAKRSVLLLRSFNLSIQENENGKNCNEMDALRISNSIDRSVHFQ